MNSIQYIFSKLISEDLFKPETHGVYVQTFPKGHCMITPHQHPTLEVITVLNGSSVMEVDGEKIKLKQGENLILSPNVNHFFYTEQTSSCRLMNVHFHTGDLSAFFELKTWRNHFASFIF